MYRDSSREIIYYTYVEPLHQWSIYTIQSYFNDKGLFHPEDAKLSIYKKINLVLLFPTLLCYYYC